MRSPHVWLKLRYVAFAGLASLVTYPVRGASEESSTVMPEENCTSTVEVTVDLRELREIWGKRCSRLQGHPFHRYGKKIDELRQLLATRVPPKYSAQLVKLQTRAGEEWDSDPGYVAALRQASIAILVARGHSRELTSLLAEGCPRHVYYLPTEVYVCLPDRKNGLKEGICVLFDAYQLCENTKNRTVIARMIRDGFEAVIGDIEEDDAFVKAAEKWYKENRARLVYNRWYAGEKHRGASPLPPILIPKDETEIEKGPKEPGTSSL